LTPDALGALMFGVIEADRGAVTKFVSAARKNVRA
jgi:hypothetical protein